MTLGFACLAMSAMEINAFCYFIAALILARAVVSLALDAMNRSYANSHAGAVPDGMEGFVDDETYARSIRYTLVHSRFSSLEMIYESAVLAFFLFSGVLPYMYRGLDALIGQSVAAQAMILVVIGQILDIPDWLTDWWSTFHIEEKFGFNKSTHKLWATDKLKGILLGVLLMYPLFCLVLVLVRVPFWWFWAFVCMFLFQLMLMVLYPMFIMPLFNKFTPLPEGELRERLMSLAQRTGFHARTILVMDGSRRSGHSNAFFSGIGKTRRVVLFDTLVEQLEPEELEGVLAHEIGHYKLGHIPKILVVAGAMTLAAFALIGWLAQSPWFVSAFGFSYDPQRLAPVLLLFSMLAGLAGFWFTPVNAMFSRKHEYQADAFARKAMLNDPEPLIRALRKLHAKNLGN
ncbi:MAG: M48 family metallopeptidase, partial [Opitutales bacterium]